MWSLVVELRECGFLWVSGENVVSYVSLGYTHHFPFICRHPTFETRRFPKIPMVQ